MRRPLPSDAGSSPKDTQLSKQICASEQTRVGAELPRPQTQSGLKAHSLSPAIGPASVLRRCAPRGSSSRRQRGGPTGRERSYAGAAQYPCAEHRGGRPRAAPRLPRRSPGLLPGYTCCAPRGHKQLPWVMGCPPHQEQRRSVTSPPGPGPSSSTPARPHAGRGGDSHKGVGSGRAVDAAGSGQSGTSPRGPEKSGRDRRASVPPSRRGRRDRRGHGARCKAVPARWAGCGPRADSERGAGPPGPAG